MTPADISPAEPAAAPTSSSAPKDVARQGVLSAVRSDPHPDTQQHQDRVVYGRHNGITGTRNTA
ncbi:hypothetical protein [Streptomyces sp. NPDC050355]|uniref:hypothetical protein n=1 Tax=Streptomyces sp. NPDC050355 TaxID=3365609 RepID=UPI0037B86D56